MQLTEEQKEVVRGIIKALNNNQVISFGGLAGVGKTTVCKTILQALPELVLGQNM
jgi:tRNA A37 threonylcarbamoyladenosine biosynthesis protein TsaE